MKYLPKRNWPKRNWLILAATAYALAALVVSMATSQIVAGHLSERTQIEVSLPLSPESFGDDDSRPHHEPDDDDD